MDMLISELVGLLRKDKLAKSDLGRGWTGEIPKIELDLSGKISSTIEKYLLGLNWVMVGDYAGKEARVAAKKIGLVDKAIPGILPSAYLHSIDSQIQFYKDLFEMTPKPIPTYLIRESLDNISESYMRLMDAWIPQLRNSITQALETIQSELTNGNLYMVHKYSHNILKDQPGLDNIPDLEEKIKTTLSVSKIKSELNNVVEKFDGNWDRLSGTELTKASAVGAHQAFVEVYGSNNDDLSVVFEVTEDERLCQWCNHMALNADGSRKIYKLKDLKPSGYNLNRKKSEWKISIVPAHYNCRCMMVYVPKGFTVGSDGILKPA